MVVIKHLWWISLVKVWNLDLCYALRVQHSSIRGKQIREQSYRPCYENQFLAIYTKKLTGLSQISASKWSNRSWTPRSGEYRVQTEFVKSSGHNAIHLAGPPTGRRPQQRPASSQQRLVARRRLAPPLALFTALLIKVIAGVSEAERGARETRGWERERQRDRTKTREWRGG